MANIVINAAVSKVHKDKASGIATAIRDKNIVGFMDLRNVIYENQTRHIAGLKYDKNERMFYMVSPKKADDVNIGIFISTYDIELVHGKIMAKEELSDVYELPSVAEKMSRGGYKKSLDTTIQKRAEVFPKKVNLKILIATAKDKLVIRNKAGFLFTCDFKTGKWHTLRPGSKLQTIFMMESDDLNIQSIFKHSLPFPALDRGMFDKESNASETFDMTKHILDNV